MNVDVKTFQHYTRKLNLATYKNDYTLLEENIGQKLHNTGFGNDFLDMISKAWVTKEKTD